MKLLMELCLVSLLLVGALANQQAWSEQTYLNKPHTLTCNFTNGNVSISTDDQLSWTRLGQEVQLVTDEYFQLLNGSGFANMLLKIRNATTETSGIYFCTVRDSNGKYIGRMVRGLNLAGYLSDDMFEEYRTDVIRGAITAAAVFVLVVGVCVVDRFRYQTDEQKQKMRERKENRLRKLQQSENGGVDNLAMQDCDHDLVKSDGSTASPGDSNTHLVKSNGSTASPGDSNTHL